MKKLIVIGSLAAATLGAAALPAAARTNVDLIVDVAPPAPLFEPVVVPRAGFVWVPGYWDWRHGRHYWVRGHYMRHRPGYYGITRGHCGGPAIATATACPIASTVIPTTPIAADPN